MAERSPRSVYNIVFIVLLALLLAWGVMGTIKFISAASGAEYSNGVT
jgi:hypothetical protein